MKRLFKILFSIIFAALSPRDSAVMINAEIEAEENV